MIDSRDTLVKLLSNHLGCKTSPVFYEPGDLGIPTYLAREVTDWWLLSHYPGQLPFQIHLVQIRNLVLYPCQDIIDSFYRKRPGYFLFIFTEDYSYLVFMTIEWSLERRPWTWQRLPKPYHRFLLLDRTRPTANDLEVLTKLRVESSQSDPSTIHKKVLEALRASEHHSDLPEWFVPWYYRLGYSQDTYENLREQGKI